MTKCLYLSYWRQFFFLKFTLLQSFKCMHILLLETIFKEKKNLTKEIQTCIHSSKVVELNTYFSTTAGWSSPEGDFSL